MSKNQINRTKLFLDTEFTGLHKNTTLMSIGVISECGKSFYFELNDYDTRQVDIWINENVVKNMIYLDHIEKVSLNYKYRAVIVPISKNINFTGYGNIHKLKHKFIDWLGQFEQVEIWSDCLSYDWVLFNDIFGTAFDIPKNVYYIPMDICTYFKIVRIDPDVNRLEFIKQYIDLCDYDLFSNRFQSNFGNNHNALFDAFKIKCCYEILESLNGI